MGRDSKLGHPEWGCPLTRAHVHLMLIEPKATRHTGDVVSERTVHEYARI